MNRFAAEYLVKAIQEERLEEARRARLVRSIAQGRRDTLERVSLRRALARLSRPKTAPEPVPSTNPAVYATDHDAARSPA